MDRSNALPRNQAIRINRLLTCTSVSMALASYLWHPSQLITQLIDIVARAYLHFIAGVMAHESVHGHLGNSRSTNQWWGRFAMLPTTVPYVTFRTTHLSHHSSTNIRERDPDEFLNTPHRWQIPLRAFALPYYWVIWMWKCGRFTRRDQMEYALHYLTVAVVYGSLIYFTSFERVLFGLLSSATLHSLLLWYAFAIKTHEGYSIGSAETRSHNYYGRFLYWFSFGLSMHRLHHMQPKLAWIQMSGQVPEDGRFPSFTLQKVLR